jgi:hypothetical protein
VIRAAGLHKSLSAAVTRADGSHTEGGFSLFFLPSLAAVTRADGSHTEGGLGLFFLLSLAAVTRADGSHKG